MIYNAFCFCPEIIQKNIKRPDFYIKLMNLAHSSNPDIMVIDRYQKLWLAYYEAVKNDPEAFAQLEIWKKYISSTHGKIEIGDTEDSDSYSAVVASTITAPLTCSKFIVSHDHNNYGVHISALKAHNIQLLSGFHFENMDKNTYKNMPYNNTTFHEDLVKAITLLIVSHHDKSEDEYNDYIRDLLNYKGYNVKDQSRAGTSASQKSKGELDLFIWENDSPRTIVESLKLKSCDSTSIELHFSKLIKNYNPLNLVNTHLVAYYTGKKNNLQNFIVSYKKTINNIINNPSMGITNTKVIDNNIECNSLLSFTIHGQINGGNFSCTHYVAAIEK